MTTQHCIFTTPVAKVYPYYIAKAEKKGRTKAEVDTILCWLTVVLRPSLCAYTCNSATLEAQFDSGQSAKKVYPQIMQMGADFLKSIAKERKSRKRFPRFSASASPQFATFLD